MNHFFFDDKWAEMVYHMLTGLSFNQRMSLSPKEQYLLRDDSQVKKFASSASIESQMGILTKLGYDWFFAVYPVGKVSMPDVMKKAYRQHTLKHTAADTIQEMIDKKVFVIDNKSVATAMAIMAQNSHSDVFVINKEFLKMPAVLEQFLKTNNPLAKLLQNDNPNSETAEYRDGIRSLETFNDIVGEAYRAEAYMESVFLINKLDYLILYQLFRHRGTYVTMETLVRELSPVFKKKSIPVRCNYLWKHRNLIDKYPDSKTSYTIKAEGIRILGEIMQMIINRAKI